jgi:flagellar motor protein MotB
MFVGCGTFGLAYYLPLYRAHRALSDDHSRLRGELETVQQKLTKAETELKSTSLRRDELEEQTKKSEAKTAGQASDASTLKGSLETALDKLVKKKLATVGADPTGARVALAAGAVFSSGKVEVSAGGAAALCAVAKAAGSHALHVIAVSTADDVPAALKTKFTSAWEYTGAAAAEVATTLHDKCSVPGAKLFAEASDGSRPTAAAFSGEKPPSPRIELWLANDAKP